MKKSAKREKKPGAHENEKNLSGKGFSQKNENFLSRKGFSQKTRIFFPGKKILIFLRKSFPGKVFLVFLRKSFPVKDFPIFMSCSKIRSSDFHRPISVSCRINWILFFVSSYGTCYHYKRENFSLFNSPLD